MVQHESGIFHAWTIDDGDRWVDIHGREHYIDTLDQDYAENILLFLLRNAARFQQVYMRKVEGINPWALHPSAREQFFDNESFAKHWMLRSQLVLALMQRLQEIAYGN